jgi:hypothetical protein
VEREGEYDKTDVKNVNSYWNSYVEALYAINATFL